MNFDKMIQRPEELTFSRSDFASDSEMFNTVGKQLEILNKLNCACVIYKNWITGDIIINYASLKNQSVIPVWLTQEQIHEFGLDNFDDILSPDDHLN